MSTFVRSRLDELPPYLAGPEGEGLATALGSAQDDELPLLRAAAVSDLPDLCPDDALEGSHTVGDWFALERYAGDDTVTYRERVKAAFSTWRKAGGAVAIEDQINAAFGCDCRVWPVWEAKFCGPADGSWYSMFAVIIGPELGTFVGTSEQFVAAKRIVLKWKATHGYPVVIYMLTGAGPVLGWGVVGGAQPLALGSFTLGGAAVFPVRIGRTLNYTMAPLGNTRCILGGYDLT